MGNRTRVVDFGQFDGSMSLATSTTLHTIFGRSRERNAMLLKCNVRSCVNRRRSICIFRRRRKLIKMSRVNGNEEGLTDFISFGFLRVHKINWPRQREAHTHRRRPHDCCRPTRQVEFRLQFIHKVVGRVTHTHRARLMRRRARERGHHEIVIFDKHRVAPSATIKLGPCVMWLVTRSEMRIRAEIT